MASVAIVADIPSKGDNNTITKATDLTSVPTIAIQLQIPTLLNPKISAVVIRRLFQILPSVVPATEFYSSNQINRLPPELQLHIFSYLDPVSSTCLGLACKGFWNIHRSRYKKVALTDMSENCIQLHSFLDEWMGKYKLVYSYWVGEFISVQHYNEMGYI